MTFHNPSFGASMALSEEQAKSYIVKLLTAMSAAGGSDLFISKDFPPSMKLQGVMKPLTNQKLSGDVARDLAQALMNDKQREDFARDLEANFALSIPGVSRFRVNVFMQQQNVGMVVRTIVNEIPTLQQLALPPSLEEIVMTKRGLVLVVGATGSGKSTSLAAMIHHRNCSSAGHIVTVEDPVEFLHQSQQSLITHREVGIDTHSWHNALKNTLRQAPDVILIGEIRDTETMEHAIAFAETGHLCLGTLHSNSANQTIDRIINFFSEERRKQLLMDLSSNLKAIISQRLIRTEDGKGRRAAVEILINTPIVADKLLKGEFHEIKSIMQKSRELGMMTFDVSLFELYDEGAISYDEAIRNADSANELRLNIKLHSKRGVPAPALQVAVG
jgi:twitching motility protein PilU